MFYLLKDTFFTKCDKEKKFLLYLKILDGTFKCVTTVLLHKHRSDTSQDALKMFQNISNVPVKQSFLMYDMLKAKIDRLAGKIILKKWPSK